MSEYKIENGELKHYGVKGMKWGVRRSLGAKARMAARYRRGVKDLDKSIARLEKKGPTKDLLIVSRRNWTTPRSFEMRATTCGISFLRI